MPVIQDQIGVLLASVIILSQLTMLWKDNFFFRWGTRIAVGFMMMDQMGWAFYYLNQRFWVPATTRGEWWWWGAILVGLMLYFRLSRQYGWVAKYPLGLQLGLGVGVASTAMLRAQILDQVVYTVRDLFTAKTGLELFNAVVAFVALATVVSYFFFTREHKGVLAGSAFVGRAFMMASIAVIWAGDYMWAMAILAGVLTFLVNSFIKGLLLGIPV